jgi:RimJ/RimL family protein N-acetyltransferase
LVDLRPLQVSDLSEVERWFDDTETQRWLGGRDWPSQSLRLAGEHRHVLLAMLDGNAVGLIDIETYPGHRASFAIVVPISARRQGIGRRILKAAIDDPRLAGIVEWFAGIERGNEASRSLVQGLGFRQVTDEDADSFTYYSLGHPSVPWSLPE